MSENCVAVLGPGLLGGSVAWAVRAHGIAEKVHLWARRESAVQEVTSADVCDLATTSLEEAVEGASLVILATPVEAMKDLASRVLAETPRSDLLISDVGSVKAVVDFEVGSLCQKNGAEFVGGHPMAGSEESGFAEARADLFQGKSCILTPGVASSEEGIERLTAFWGSLGANVSLLEPETHDAVVGRISHLPHVAAAAVVLAALEGTEEAGEKFVGNGFLDTTRIASGDPALWLGILRENRDAVVPPLIRMRDQLSEVLEMLQGMDEEGLVSFLADAKKLRDGCKSRDESS